MAKRHSEIATSKSDAEVAEAVGAYLASQGFDRTASRKKNLWRKGLIWSVFASSRVEAGVASLEVWNYAPIPGMGSFLMYFMNRGRLQDYLEALQAVVAGEIVAAQPTEQVELRYAGFWRRFGALLIDGLLFYVAFGLVFAVAYGLARGASAGGGSDARLVVMNMLSALALVAAWLYFALLESSRSQATLGKKALGLKVTDDRGARLSFGRASGRFWSKLLSFFIVGVGFFIAAFTGKKQALHDLMARTLVVRR